MSRIHFLAAGLFVLGMAIGCKAQSTPPQPASTDPALSHHIEVMVRSQFNVPPDFSVVLGARKPSQIPGYDSLPITISHGAKSQQVDFMISADGKTLARFEKFDLANDPLFSIDVAGRPIRGNPAAKVTVINFDDLECPYCARMHQTLFPATLMHYKDTVRFIYKDDPLVEIHPWAMHAAVDANCLAAQSSDVYWTYVDYLHAHGQEVNGENRDVAKSFDALNRIARQQATLGKLDAAQLDACIARQDETQVKASAKQAETLGVDGTPALFIEGERISGAMPQEQIWLVIDRALRAAGVEPPPEPAPPAASQAAPVQPTPAQAAPAQPVAEKAK
ncbi:MAG: thioredoxin domain-containing protein [Terracidiphilus sp.]